MKSFDAIIHQLYPEDFDPMSKGNGVLIPLKDNKTFFHSGDFGDIIYALPTIRALGGGSLVIGPSKHWKTRLRMSPEHVEILRPLLMLQPYIHDVRYADDVPDNTDIDLNQFREYLLVEREFLSKGSRRLNLAESHLYTFKLPLSECDRAWLTVDRPLPVENHPVLLHRSSRWRNANFPWNKIMERHGSRAAFVGLPEEHADFVKEWGDLPYLPTKDFLELARLIAGCQLYIGNQSLPYAICEGLKQRSILEVWPEGPNCLFNRKNTVYGEGATLYIPKLTTTMNTAVTDCPLCSTDSSTATQYRVGTDIVQCSTCQLVYLRTRPDAEATLHYYQQYADDHSHMRLPKNFDEVRSSGLRREYFMQELLSHVPDTKSEPLKLLDIGCGWGAFLANAREKGFVPFGIDVCHKAANFASSILGINAVCDQLEDCRFTDGMFDVVVAIHTLEHLPNSAFALASIQRILKPNGLFCGIVPNIESFCSTTLKEKWQWLDNHTHYVHFSPTTLQHALEKHGFETVKIYTHTGDYDDRELRQLLAARDHTEPNSENTNAAIKTLWETGHGEEIRFFAKVKA